MNKKIHILIIFIVVIFFSSCSTTQKQNKLYKQIIGIPPGYARSDSSIFIINKGDLRIPDVNFYYLDSWLFGAEQTFSLKKDMIIPMFLKSPTFIKEAGGTGNFYYVYPKCTLQAFQNTDGYIEFKDLNGNKEKNNEMNFFQKLIFSMGQFNKSLPYPYDPLDSLNYTIPTFYKIESKLNDLKNKRLFFLDSLTAKLPVSNHFKDLARDIINKVALQDSLLLYFEFKNILVKNNLFQQKLIDALYKINNSAICSPEYFTLVCNTLLNLLENKPPSITTVYSIEEYNLSIDTIKKYFKKVAKDYLLTEKYIMASKRNNLGEINFNNLLPIVENEDFKNYLVHAHNEIKIREINDGGNNLIDLKGNTIDIENIIAKHKGKLILLDFWASWCVPCRENMPILKDLEKSYKGKKIVFISISLDKNTTGWKAASMAELLDIQNSFSYIDKDQPKFIRNYEIKQIPRYMFIDDNGKIIDADCPAPNSLKLKELIDKNLEN